MPRKYLETIWLAVGEPTCKRCVASPRLSQFDHVVQLPRRRKFVCVRLVIEQELTPLDTLTREESGPGWDVSRCETIVS